MIKVGKYKHFKGGEYEVIGIARQSETLDDLVIYRHYGKTELWARPIKMFCEKVVVDGKEIARYEYISD